MEWDLENTHILDRRSPHGTAFWVAEFRTDQKNTFSVHSAGAVGKWIVPGSWKRDTGDLVPSPYREAVYRLRNHSGQQTDLLFVLAHRDGHVSGRVD